MLLALDESDKSQKIQCIGVVAIPNKELVKFEADFTELRFKNKFWQELKWQNIRKGNRYDERYKPFIDLFFKYNACFYVWSYSYPTQLQLDRYFDGNKAKIFHKYAFKIICSTRNKIAFSPDITNPDLHIIYDKGSDSSESQIKLTKEYLQNSRSVVPILFCGEADSKILGLLQIADILTGCASAEENDNFVNDERKQLYNYIISKASINNIFVNQPVLPFGALKIDGFKVVHTDDVGRKTIA